ncbi:MAG: acylphosphatase [Methylococcaceae bacterium]|nr:acylphosphatase [Methylococcaceae bacterium]
MRKRVHLWISGRVQGVFYRASAAEQAQALGLAGWARNLSDGRVEIVAEGDGGKLDAFLGWCSRGPSRARVEEVEMTEELANGEFTDFRVRRDG